MIYQYLPATLVFRLTHILEFLNSIEKLIVGSTRVDMPTYISFSTLIFTRKLDLLTGNKMINIFKSH